MFMRKSIAEDTLAKNVVEEDRLREAVEMEFNKWKSSREKNVDSDFILRLLEERQQVEHQAPGVASFCESEILGKHSVGYTGGSHSGWLM